MLLALTACVSPPQIVQLDSRYPENAIARPAAGEPLVAPHVQALVDHIRCEIVNAYYAHVRLWADRNEVARDFTLRSDNMAADGSDPKALARVDAYRRAAINARPYLASIEPDYLAQQEARTGAPGASTLPSPPTDEKHRRWSPEITLWNELYNSHFQAAVDLTVLITNSEGASLPISATQPLDYRGGKLPASALDATVAKGTQPTDSYGLTLAVSADASAFQDNYFDLEYVVDVHDLIDDAERSHFFLTCNDHDKRRGSVFNDPLLGSLRLEETIGAGLSGIQEANLYDFESNTAAGPTRSTAQMSAKAIGGSPTAFSSKIDFDLTWSGSISPSINTLWLKVGGASGGGAGGASDGGGGGQGGGGSGGGRGATPSGLVSGGRQRLDTMLVTFSAICRSSEPNITLTGSAQPNSLPDGQDNEFHLSEIPLSERPDSPVVAYVDIAGQQPIDLTRRGMLQFNGAVWLCAEPGCSTPTPLTASFTGYFDESTINLNGALADPLNVGAAGTISLRLGRSSHKISVHLELPPSQMAQVNSGYAAAAHSENQAIRYYWDALPLCSADIVAAGRQAVSSSLYTFKSSLAPIR